MAYPYHMNINKPFKILVADTFPAQAIKQLEQADFAVSNKPHIQPQELLEEAHQYEILIIRSKCRLKTEFFKNPQKLMLIGRAGAGLDLIDLEAAHEAGIHIVNAPEGNKDAVAEHSLGLMLSLLHKIWASAQDIRRGVWDRNKHTGFEIKGKTIGLIGMGNMGRATAQLLQNFGCKILAYDRVQMLQGLPSYITSVSLAQLKQEADIVSFHIPLDEQNYQLVNETYLNAFKKSIYLINTSRGEIIDHSCLLPLLNAQKLLGIGLDVFENEKIETHTPHQKLLYDQLRQDDRVIMTPHIAGITHDSFEKIGSVLVQKILSWRSSLIQN
ncbi:MAG: phosphoglycerate dehydrogenase [Cytophagales bacterium]|nr:MAG: phosphoglycerate dehydrogenase [Cytophagales bacterium]TAF59482.1 MAG: phosphoglycerate dehydrogenase [Cytophagales bacterium]